MPHFKQDAALIAAQRLTRALADRPSQGVDAPSIETMGGLAKAWAARTARNEDHAAESSRLAAEAKHLYELATAAAQAAMATEKLAADLKAREDEVALEESWANGGTMADHRGTLTPTIGALTAPPPLPEPPRLF